MAVDANAIWFERLEAARRGENPTRVGRLRTAFAFLADTQFLPGYCVLVYDGDASDLTDLEPAGQAAFLADLADLGAAVRAVCARRDRLRRMNYEILGNSWEHLHAHVTPRYAWEPEPYRSSPAMRYPDRNAPRHRIGPEHEPLKLELAAELAARAAGGWGAASP